jgi:hypothetical protein
VKIIRPLTIDTSNLTSSIAEDDGPEYSAAATYAQGDVVINAAGAGATHHAYESLADNNIGHALDDADWWLDRGATNRFRMFDQVNGTLTVGAAGSIDVTIDTTSRADGLALFGMDAAQVQVIVTSAAGTIYDETYPLNADTGINSWYEWLTQEVESQTELVLLDLPPNQGNDVRVIISGPDEVSCGTMVLGQQRDLGSTPLGAKGGITDYSKKDTDDFGNIHLVPRAYSKRWSFQPLVEKQQVDPLFRILTQYRATPIVWIGAEEYSSTIIYGWARDWNVAISYPTQSLLSLEIEGLI